MVVAAFSGANAGFAVYGALTGFHPFSIAFSSAAAVFCGLLAVMITIREAK